MKIQRSADPSWGAQVVMASLGVTDAFLGILCNEWVVTRLFRPDHQLEPAQKILVDAMLVGVGATLYLARHRVRYVNVILAAHILTYGLTTSELVLRRLEIRAHFTSDGRPAIRVSETFHHDFVPNQTFTTYISPLDGDWVSSENKINRLGMRGPEIPPKRDDEFRVLLLGDSFIEADEIPYPLTVGQELTRLLGNPRVRVLQYGMFGWSPLLELNWIVKRGLALEPDVIVLFLCINDFYSASSGWSDASYTREAVFDTRGLPIEFKVVNTTRRPWNDLLIVERLRALFRFWRQGPPRSLTQGELDRLLQIDASRLDAELEQSIPRELETRSLLIDIIKLARPTTSWDEETLQTVGITIRYLDIMERILREQRVRLIITLIPDGWNVSLRDNLEGRKRYALSGVIVPLGGIEEMIRRFCRNKSVEYVDLHAIFTAEEAKGDQPLYLSVDGHWNPRGHQVVAKALYGNLFSKRRL